MSAAALLRSRTARRRAWILAIELSVFLVLVFLFANATLDRDDSAAERMVALIRTTIGVVAGPLAGAIARPGHSGCLKFSLSLLPICGAILAGGILVQLFRARSRIAAEWLLPAAWTIGWLAWFGGALVSLGHALE